MVGSTAQLVALACHFNGRARTIASPGFFPGNSTSQFCEFVHFVRRSGGWLRKGKWTMAAQSPDEWLAVEALPSRRAFLTRQEAKDPKISDRMSAGFVGGGGIWELNVLGEGRADSWRPSWAVGNRNASDRRIWRVTYAHSDGSREHTPSTTESLDHLRARFQKDLGAMLAFCEDQKIEGFATFFRNAEACLSSNDPFSLVYHKDMAPPGVLTLAAQQLLAACNAAWVFGGMGSWNDLMFDGRDQERYAEISERLFLTLNEAICAATNSGAAL